MYVFNSLLCSHFHYFSPDLICVDETTEQRQRDKIDETYIYKKDAVTNISCPHRSFASGSEKCSSDFR